VREIRVGLRPASPDGLPLLGAAPAASNVYLAAGHGPTGLQLGPYSGKLIADLMLGRAVVTDLSALDVTRFS
jgi:D-amino-acid dehydrogenase